MIFTLIDRDKHLQKERENAWVQVKEEAAKKEALLKGEGKLT